MSSRRSSTIQCNDCGTHVVNLTSHRINCMLSRRNRIKLAIAKPSIALSSRTGQISIHLPTQLVASLLDKQKAKAASQDVVFLLDVSGSMEGRKLASAKEAIANIASELDEFDRLSLITFDNEAFQKLKPRAMGQLRRQDELPALLSRIFARGITALYDAVIAGIEQIRDKDRRTSMLVLTDGEDNASKHTLQQAIALLEQYPNVSLTIVYTPESGASRNVAAHQQLCAASQVPGTYIVTEETEIVTQVTRVFRRVVKNQVLPN